MGGICDGSKNPKNSGSKECESQIMEDKSEEGLIPGA